MPRPLFAAIALLLAGGALLAARAVQQSATSTAPPEEIAPRGAPLRIAVIGDYGNATPEEAAVAALVKSLQPHLVFTLGDNNYPSGEASTIDLHIGQHYHEFIAPYGGAYGAGASVNRFFPSLGNHDWNTPGAAPYLAYFDLPGNERYYEKRFGAVHLFALDSDPHEPDGVLASSAQASWLQSALAASTAPFKVVTMHHPPYSSGAHGSNAWMQWPYEAWGATAVLGGHDHLYERIVVGELPCFVNGLGGARLYSFGADVTGSKLRLASNHGAMLLEATDASMTARAIDVTGNVLDTFTFTPGAKHGSGVVLVPTGSTWKYLDDGSSPGPAWADAAFDDSAWAAGPAQLGYGDDDEATTIGYGPNPDAKFITSWFRRTFQAPPSTGWTGLRLRVLADDGAMVRLNGVEVLRMNLPAGPVGPLTPATANVTGDAENAYAVLDLPAGAVSPGPNVLAVEVHQSGPTSGDVSFELDLTALLPESPLVAAGADWRFLDTGTAPPAGWREVGFDDAAWGSGPAPLGYGDGDEATVVGFGPDPLNKHVTTYFRRVFQAAGPGAHAGLLLRIQKDDGAVVFLNGQEVYRANLPYGPVGNATLAPAAIGGADESAVVETSVDPRLLLAGANVVAVEIHQSSGASSDVSFDLALVPR